MALKLTKLSAARMMSGDETKHEGYWEEKVRELEEEKGSLIEICRAYKKGHDKLINLNNKLSKRLTRATEQLQATNQELMRLRNPKS